ncbi:MAG: hypothetical protein ACRDPS_15200 [Nocardioides sp.]|uniref:hypothetical protein n=1 Tax=Nocardioides sp. TaxID=35761 RepID=UPI003D6AD5A7
MLASQMRCFDRAYLKLDRGQEEQANKGGEHAEDEGGQRAKEAGAGLPLGATKGAVEASEACWWCGIICWANAPVTSASIR